MSDEQPMSKFGDHEDQPFLAELYDLVPQYAGRGDLEFYVNVGRQAGGNVLELGCGTGRVLIPIAAAGIEVVGLDLSAHMLAKCRQKLAAQPEDVQRRVRLVQSRMTEFSLGETFGAIIIPFRPFQHLVSVADQLACLQCVNAHLRMGGILAFDLFQVDLRKISIPGPTEETEDLPEFSLPNGRRMRRCNRFVASHRAEQYNEVEIIYYITDKSGKMERLVQGFPFRYFFRYEVEHLLVRTGFQIGEIYGNFDKSPLADNSPEMIFVARKIANNNGTK
jgi:SAM-dependent methyltransferase